MVSAPANWVYAKEVKLSHHDGYMYMYIYVYVHIYIYIYI